MAMYDVSIRNGRLGRPGGVVSANVAISGSRTVCLGNPGNERMDIILYNRNDF